MLKIPVFIAVQGNAQILGYKKCCLPLSHADDSEPRRFHDIVRATEWRQTPTDYAYGIRAVNSLISYKS